MVVGPPDSGKTSWFCPFEGIITVSLLLSKAIRKTYRIPNKSTAKKKKKKKKDTGVSSKFFFYFKTISLLNDIEIKNYIFCVKECNSSLFVFYN